MAEYRFPAEPASRGGNDNVAGHSHSHIAGQAHQELQHYSKKDLDIVTQFDKDAEKLLGKLDIDHSGGVSRSEILKAESKPHLSEQNKKILDGLINLEPSIQEAWQVPSHRLHLQAHSDAQFYRTAAPMVAKMGDREWAEELTKQADKIDPGAKVWLASDRIKQESVFFNDGAVNKEKLNELKDQINKIEVAANVMPQADKLAASLLKHLDVTGRGITAADLERFAVDKNVKNLSPAEQVVLHGIVDCAMPDPAHSKITQGEMAEAVKTWAAGELRADGYGSEKLFYRALHGYQGDGLDVHTKARFDREMDSKDGSQLKEDERARDYTRVPHFPKS